MFARVSLTSQHMKIFIPFIFLAFGIFNPLFGQNDWRIYNPSSDSLRSSDTVRGETLPDAQVRPGKIDMHMDKRIARLDSLKKIKPTAMEGYRVQLFFGGRKEAQDARVEFLRKHPDTGAYISYLAPNFRLRVGDFRSRIESEEFKNEIARDFPGSYIVKDHIELPPLRNERDGEE